MFGSIFDKTTGLFDRQFVLGLLLPTFAFFAGIGALVATDLGWTQTISWWQHLGTSRQVIIAIAATGGLVFAATVFGTQVGAITQVLEGYWRWAWADKTIGEIARRWQRHRRTQLDKDANDPNPRLRDIGYLRLYLAFPDPEVSDVLPTRLGNTRRAAESYSGDGERWGLDASFWWPRLYLIIPDSAREQVDDARTSMDQMILLSVLSVLSAVFAAIAVGFGIGGLRLAVWAWSAGGALVLSWLTYRSAIASATTFGDLVRSCFDLYRTDLLAHLGWPLPERLPDERTLWLALQQQLYRRSASYQDQHLVDAPRIPPSPALQVSEPVKHGRLRQFLRSGFSTRSAGGPSGSPH